jgi:alkylation response protein AidB-like acyl-CoA dehydrogenase
MRADLDGDHYVLNGTKTWTTLGQHADWIFLLARTSTDVARRQEGISFLLVDMKTPGVTVNPIITIEGDHEVNEVHFEDVRVPVENLVGEEGKGWTYGKVLLQHERANIAGVAISKYRLRKLRKQTKKSVRGARPLSEDRNFMRNLAAVETDLRALEYTELRTLAAVQSGKAPGPESSILKVKGTEIQQAIDTLYLEAAGYYALPYVQEQYALESDPADWVGEGAETQYSLKYFNYRKASIYGGSNESNMDFSFNEIQAMLDDSIEKFIANDYDFEKRQKYAASDKGYSRDVWQTFAELGWTSVPFSEEDGGFGGGPADLIVVMLRFGKGLVVEPYLANIVLSGGVLRRAASEEQKERWLHPIIAGELQSALAYAEPQSRYDIADICTTATADGEGWVLNGNKAVVFNGGNAELLIVTARTAGAQNDEDGVTLFAIPADSDGLGIRAYPTVDGHQAAEISLDNVSVDGASVIGEPGRGFVALDAAIDDATLAVSAEAVGIMQIMTDKTVEYSKSRMQFGVPIGSFQALQHRMVDMFTDCEQSYSLLLWATMLAAQGDANAKRAISSIKYQVGTVGRKVGQEAVQIHGGMGVSWEVDIAHYFKRLTTIDQILGNADWHLDRLAG